MKRITLIIKFIQTKEFAFLALVFSLVPQIIHSFSSFYSLAVNTEDIISEIGVITGGIFFSIGLSGAILILTLAGWTRMAIGALVVEFFVNLVYYKIWVDDLLVLHVLRSIYGLIMPLAIALYSHVMEFFIKKEEQIIDERVLDIKKVEDNVKISFQNIVNQIPKENNIEEYIGNYIKNNSFVLRTEKGNELKVDLKEYDSRDTESDKGDKTVSYDVE